jgi:hypothetical protein
MYSAKRAVCNEVEKMRWYVYEQRLTLGKVDVSVRV